MKLLIKKGLDIPMSGKPEGPLQTLPRPPQIALNFDSFEELRFKVLVKPGDRVKAGQPLAENKSQPGQNFVAPGSGVVAQIRRGLKRRLASIVLDLEEEERFVDQGSLALNRASREEIVDRLMRGGIFPYIRMRPFNLVADPKYPPRDIFVKALESAPYMPPVEMQVAGFETYFQTGLESLSKLTSGKVHLVYREGSHFSSFVGAKNLQQHTVQGPHPAANSSVHIHHINPIKKSGDVVWTLSAIGVIAVGRMIEKGRYHCDRVLGIAGNGILEGRRGFFKGRAGFPISGLIENRVIDEPLRFISGDPLTGEKVTAGDFLGFYHTAFSVIPENTMREAFHFFRLGAQKYSAHRVYLSGLIKPPREGYDFTTNQHGEERAFIDGSIFEKVMPMRIPTMQLVKAVLAEDFELAEKLGLLEVDSEDFALPTFICPSKIEMIEIMKQGIHRYAKEMGH